ncbi:AEC family transporter [Pontibacillus yanchengensis]|uniref:AEC family transporter n=2 Tax=Pontibacillus yanchengensis TaxID=462910 RepID=A0ACC7VCA1_9BACI|nr:AEC family transporter [Pontibacillus yanchengensis]MYL32038.1 AEC family transporter [Pontibacillus yanchengensis]MYL52616.1 AEC family transporter [Pontibacillus yanchengensis]
MSVFIEVVLPVLLVFLSGYGIQKWKKLDIKSVSTIAIYILTPCLVFETFYDADLNSEYVSIVIFSIGLLVSIITINKVMKKVNGYNEAEESGMILSTAFMNSGNYGAPIVLFAFGEEGFAYSISFLVLQAIIMNFFGVYYAARGQAGMKLAFQSVLKMPATYAAIISLLLNVTNVPMSENILSAIKLIANGAIPGVMIVLGMQLADISIKSMEWGKITYATSIRLLASPLIAFGLVMILPMGDLLGKVLILSAAMPSAATTTMYAVEFDSRPELVSSITLVTTLASIITITVLLTFMA